MTDSQAAPPPAQVADAPSSSGSSSLPAAAAPKKLTAKQQAVWDLTRPVSEGGQGKTRKEAAAMLGISAPVVSKTLQACYRKNGIRHKKGQHSVSTAVEHRHPEKAAALMDVATDPFVNLREEYRKLGLPQSTGQAILKRLSARYAPVMGELRAIKKNDMIKGLEERIGLGFNYMDEKAASEASWRDHGMALKQMIEALQLLKGEPTVIISDHERKKLHELAPALLAEVKRRGLTIEGEVTSKVVTQESNATA